jgi:hypothetical protein
MFEGECDAAIVFDECSGDVGGFEYDVCAGSDDDADGTGSSWGRSNGDWAGR